MKLLNYSAIASCWATTLLLMAPVLTITANVSPIRVILVGDSTMATNSGYGDALCARFKREVSCLNMAKGGRSSKSYRAEGSWEKVKAMLAEGKNISATYVLIQFGHNDQPGKGERSTTLSEFSENLAAYAKDVHDAGAIPVLITPLTRRQFKQGRLVTDLSSWAEATREVANKDGVALLDLQNDSVKTVQKLGPTRANNLAQAPPPANVAAAALTGTTIEAPKLAPGEASRVLFDYTHLGVEGAKLFSDLVAAEIRHSIPSLKGYL